MNVCSTTVNIPRDEHKVVRVDKPWRIWSRKLFVAIRNEIPRPPHRELFIEAEWNKIVREELELHLRNINNEIRYACQGRDTRESILEPELLLTGNQSGKSISLSPRIWFRCGSSWAEKIVRKETHGLSWMVDRGLGDRIETGLKSVILVSKQVGQLPRHVNALLDAGLEPTARLPYGYTLNIFVQKIKADDSRYGLLCSVLVMNDGEVKHHSICRAGGLITVNDGKKSVTFAVTSAHGLLDHFLSTNAFENNRHSRSESRMSVTGFMKSVLRDHQGHSKPRLASISGQTASTGKYGTISQQDIDSVEWEPVHRVYSTNWLGGGWETGQEFQHPFSIKDPGRLAPDADFALLELLSGGSQDVQGHEQPKQHIKGWLKDDELISGTLEVVLGSCTRASGINSVPAHLLHERPRLYLRGGPFPTRKLRLEKPLGTQCNLCQWRFVFEKLTHCRFRNIRCLGYAG